MKTVIEDRVIAFTTTNKARLISTPSLFFRCLGDSKDFVGPTKGIRGIKNENVEN